MGPRPKHTLLFIYNLYHPHSIMEITTDKQRNDLIAMCAARHINLWLSQKRYAGQESQELLHTARFIQSISNTEGNLFRAVIRPEGRLFVKQEVRLKRFSDIVFDVQRRLQETSMFDFWADYCNAFAWQNGFDLISTLQQAKE